jgi:osmotically-inducible protein OsmY
MAMGRYLSLPFLLLLLVLSGCRTNESPEQQVNDLEITSSLKAKLASDVGLSTVPNISVNSTNGVVTLSGQVDTAEQKAKAESIARATPHVVRVVDNIQLTSKPQ